MKIEELNLAHAFQIKGAPGLDTITVLTQDLGPGVGRVIVECYGMAWTAYWGGMPEGKTVIEFMASMDEYYLANKLSRPKSTKADSEYLARIASAIHYAIRYPGE